MAIKIAAIKAQMAVDQTIEPYKFEVKAPNLPPGVVPSNENAPALAMDSAEYAYLNQAYVGTGFPGYSYLAQLATRAEFRSIATSFTNELTRAGIKFTSKQDDDTDTADKIKIIEAEFKRLKVMSVMLTAAQNECYFGRGQIFIEIKGADLATPLILSDKTIAKNSLVRLKAIEPIWTTPSAYNATDPTQPDFYVPNEWYILGKRIHASRLLTSISRPLPDILKPAFNFSGMSLSQLAEPYVDNWLRTRQSVSDLLNNFSTTVLATALDQVLQGDDNGEDMLARADLFTACKTNKGLMILDKEREELLQVNTPLSGLHELQAQSQEQMCSVSRIPAIILTGISPSGLNASSEGELRVFYDWISSQQNAFWREPLETILQLVQLSKFGEIDPDIGLDFVALYQMTEAERADIRLKDAQTDQIYINSGVVDVSETREKLARDPDSQYQGLDTSMEIVPPNNDDGAIDASVSEKQHNAMEAAAHGKSTLGIPKKVGKEFVSKDAEFEESKHPRADNGQFGSGGGGSAPAKKSKAVKLKPGTVQIAEPLNVKKDEDFGDYVIDHPNIKKGEFVPGKNITIKDGKVIGMTPALAKRLGVETVGEPAEVAKKPEAPKVKSKAAFMGGVIGIKESLAEGKITEAEARKQFDELKAEYGYDAESY